MFLQRALTSILLFVISVSVADEYNNKAGGYRSKEQSYQKEESYRKEEGYGEDGKKSVKGGRYYYGGKYSGKCGPDGLYYRDDYSFVLCSNAKGYVQPCAPGTRNSGYNDYAPGYYYGYSDFCDVNLVDYGYSAPKYGPGYSDKPSYGFAAYRYPVGNGNYGPKSLGGYQQNVYNKFDGQGQGQGYAGHRDSYGHGRERYDENNNGGYRGEGYQTRNNYQYKDAGH